MSRPAPGLSLGLALGLLAAATPLAGQEQKGTPELGRDTRVGGSRYASPHGPLAIELDCDACHEPSGWGVDPMAVAFDHAASGFALEGRHATVRCVGCHLDLRFAEPRIARDDCASCHADLHQESLGPDCASCHDPDGFEGRTEPDVHARTSFPLTGSHLLVHCESCHWDDRRPRFDALDTECFSCHRSDYQTTTAADHVGRGFSTDCLECHNTVAWFHQVRTPPPGGGW